MSALDDLVRELTGMRKGDLQAVARALAIPRGDEWIIGGPDKWSKDELISYIADPTR